MQKIIVKGKCVFCGKEINSNDIFLCESCQLVDTLNTIREKESMLGAAEKVKALDDAIKSIRMLDKIDDIYGRVKEGDISEDRFFYYLQNIFLFGDTLEVGK